MAQKKKNETGSKYLLINDQDSTDEIGLILARIVS
jgi:hypothetical protein